MALETVHRDVLGTEYVVVALKCDLNPLSDAVKIALVTRETRDAPQWLPSSEWVPGQTWVNWKTPVFARALVGPDGDVALVRGKSYTVKARISDSPEVPVIPCYTLVGD